MFLRYGFILLLVLASVRFSFAQINCPPHLPLTLLGNTSYCVGSPGSELSIEQSYVGYEWLPTSEVSQNVLLTAGSYQVVVTHYTGCTDTLAFVVEQVSNPPQPTIDVSGPTEFCEGGSVTLSVPVWYPYYEWSTGSVSEEITVFESGTFIVSIEDWIGCVSSSNSVQIIVNPLPVAAFSPNLEMYDIQFNNLSLNATDYEWNFGDGTFSTDFEPTHSYTSGGTLPMWLVANNDCGSDTAFLNLESVGINAAVNQTDFSIYPNPNNGQFFIQMNSDIGDDLVLSVYNCVGQTVYTRSIQNAAGIITVDSKQFQSGVYMVQIETTKGIHAERFIVQN
ncbi:MAG: T9SS type A sorting domain-containing protein [Flavobacteriales bacterium]|nr:T9SS type A sorting domain-containing protein [Flavobacteriales bacterium]